MFLKNVDEVQTRIPDHNRTVQVQEREATNQDNYRNIK